MIYNYHNVKVKIEECKCSKCGGPAKKYSLVWCKGTKEANMQHCSSCARTGGKNEVN